MANFPTEQTIKRYQLFISNQRIEQGYEPANDEHFDSGAAFLLWTIDDIAKSQGDRS